MELFKQLSQDWEANKKNPKGRLVMFLFRLAYALRFGPIWLWPLALVYGIFYRVTVEWIMGIELPWKTQIGPGLRIDHGQALVVNDGVIMGSHCLLRNGVTIGNKQAQDGTFTSSPTLGDRVDVGANATIVGPLRIGNDVVVGAGAVVVKDVPSGAVVAGNPARVLRINPTVGKVIK